MHTDYELNARLAELQDIAALDRMAADGQPAAVLTRWATRDRGTRSGGLRRLLHLGR